MKIFLFAILCLAFFLRIYGLNWDQGFNLHPDERQIILVTTRVNLPESFDPKLLLSPESPLNPHFFAYGNFPIYLLKGAALVFERFEESFNTYSGLHFVGRFISLVAELGIIFLLFKLGKRLFNDKIGILSSLFYTLSVLAIQTSHFYVVDTLLTFFILATLYRLLIFYTSPTLSNALFVGFLFGLSLATKTSALVLIVSFCVTLAVDFLLVFIKQPHKPHVWFPHIPKILKMLFTNGLLILVVTVITFILFEPYALIDFNEFWRQTLEQSKMTRDPFTFPFTLQYVGKIPYVYEIKNLFLWGQGPILATLSVIGTVYMGFLISKKERVGKWAQELILLTFLIAYFVTVGKFAIGFMRYLLPLYPLLALFAAVFLYRILSSRTRFGTPIITIIVTLILIWPLTFLNIYKEPHTRISASDWINKNVPYESTLAVEHWDDALPLFGQQNYKTETLSLYDPDTSEKWQEIQQQLSRTNYIIIASNRLYVPLQKLTNCKQLPPGKCYPITADYYKKLFNGSLGFKKIAEFAVYPALEIGKGALREWKFEIDDSSADESFTVYDHPKIMIFKKVIQ